MAYFSPPPRAEQDVEVRDGRPYYWQENSRGQVFADNTCRGWGALQ